MAVHPPSDPDTRLVRRRVLLPRTTPRFATVAGLTLGVALAVLAPAAAGARAVPSSGAVPPSVKVKTSRGDFTLMLYPPADEAGPGVASAGAAGAGAAGAREPGGGDPRPLILLVSGEGGWRSFDVLLAGIFSQAGYWVGGVDAKQYFWNAQDDRRTLAEDMRLYAEALARAAGWADDRPVAAPLVLAGFSFGADLAPWIAGAGGWGGRVRGLLMLGPDETGSLEFRLSEIMGFEAKDHIFSVAEALQSAAGIPALFVHGGKDTKSAAPFLAGKAAEPKKLIVVPGADHHFSGREEGLRAALREGLKWMLKDARTPPAPRSGP